MRSSRTHHAFLAFAAMTMVSVAAHAGDPRTEARPVVDAPPVGSTTTTASDAPPSIAPATATTPPAATRPANTAMTPERRFDGPSPQAPDDGEIEYRLMVRMASLDPQRLGDVHVRSVRGAVTLYGTVPDQASRDRALVMANTFDGVRVVRDEMDLRGRDGAARGGGPTDDATVSSQATRAVQSDPGVVGRPLEVTSQRGVITVRGTVATFADARRVLSIVKNVPGVVAVRPALQVNQTRIVNVDGDRNARR